MDPREALVAALKREVQLLRAENAYFRIQVVLSRSHMLPETLLQLMRLHVHARGSIPARCPLDVGKLRAEAAH